MSYAKITDITIRNFMSIGNATLSFDESGILNIKGFNDSGKSAVIRALGVALMNKYPTKQVKFIRDGHKYFKIVVSFEDGVKLVRVKFKDGKSLLELIKGGEKLYTNRTGEAVGKVDAVPDIIAKYLGLIDLGDNGYLNLRLNTDLAFLSQTKGSDNFRMLNEAMKTEEISNAVAMVNKDRNEATQDVNRLDYEYNHTSQEVLRYRWASQKMLTRLEGLHQEYNGLLKNLSLVKAVGGTLNACITASSRVAPKLSKIPVNGCKTALALQQQLQSVQAIKPKAHQAIGVVGTGRVEVLEGLREQLHKIESNSVNLQSVAIVETSKLARLAEIAQKLGVLTKGSQGLKSKAEALKDNKKELYSLIEMAKSEGESVVKCSNCGEWSVADGISD